MKGGRGPGVRPAVVGGTHFPPRRSFTVYHGASTTGIPHRRSATTATIVSLALSLAACQTPAIKDRVVEVSVPIATKPLKPADVPVLPKPLPPRPSSLSAAADILLSKVCEWVGYGLRADPLLKVSAGEKQNPAAAYPECEGR